MHPSGAFWTGGESLKKVEGLAGVVSWKDAVSHRTPIRIDVGFVATDEESCLSLSGFTSRGHGMNVWVRGKGRGESC